MRLRPFLATLATACSLALWLQACELPTAPLPEGALPYSPNPELTTAWWRQVEQCSGMRGDLSRIKFYLIPEVSTFQWEGQEVIGLWMERDSRIVLAGDFAFRENNVRHEMLHALIRLPGHPPEFFVQRCGALVDQAR